MMAATLTSSRQDEEKLAILRLGAKNSVRLVAVACMAIFAWAIWMASSFPPAFSPVDVGPGRVPLMAAIFGIVCSVILFFGATGTSDRIEVPRPLRVASGVVIIMAYVLLMPVVGFYVSSLIAFPLLMLAGGEQRVPVLIASTSVYLLFIYLCFERLLEVQFP